MVHPSQDQSVVGYRTLGGVSFGAPLRFFTAFHIPYLAALETTCRTATFFRTVAKDLIQAEQVLVFDGGRGRGGGGPGPDFVGLLSGSPTESGRRPRRK